MKSVCLPSFFKSKMFDKNLFALSESFSSLEGDSHIVTEIHMNEIDHEILKNDEGFKKEKENDFEIWTALIVVDDSLENIVIYGAPANSDFKSKF